MSTVAASHTTSNVAGLNNNVRELVSEEEWKLRVELAACYRVFDHLGWIELIFNHITLRVPGPDTYFLINPYGLMYSEVTASNLVKIDLDGNKMLPSDWDVNPAGFVIHSAIHAHRDDAHCIMHTHTTTGMAVACMEKGLQNDNFYTSMLMDDIAYHDFEGITTELGERERLVANLGDKNSFILRNHGLLTCGHTVADAFFRLWRLQRACDVHYATHAMAGSGGSVIPISDAAVRQSTVSNHQQQENFNTPQRVFDAMIRIVDKKDDSYKD